MDTTEQLGEAKCFFCDQSGEKLHKACIQVIDRRIRECAIVLCDSKLQGKLAMTDMHALDALYHKQCLVTLYNHMRKHLSTESSSSDSSISVESVVHAELASFIE